MVAFASMNPMPIPSVASVRRLRLERRCVDDVEAVAAVADVEHQVVVGAARRAIHGTRRRVGGVVQQIQHRLPQCLVGRDARPRPLAVAAEPRVHGWAQQMETLAHVVDEGVDRLRTATA